MSRDEFSKRTKLEAYRLANGRCQCCTARLQVGRIEYHHDLECEFGGTAELSNCVVLCTGCHAAITRKRAADIAKSTRIRNMFIGIKPRPRGRPLPGTRASGVRKRMDGRVERWPS